MYRLLLCSVVCLVLLNPINSAAPDFCWRDYLSGDIPADAVLAAPGRYIGQVNHDGYLPTTIYAYNGKAIGESSGKRVFKNNIKIMCSKNRKRFYWEYVKFDQTPDAQMVNAVKGGYQQDGDLTLYIGKVWHNGEWKISRVIDIENPRKGISIWGSSGESITIQQFHLLKYNDSASFRNDVQVDSERENLMQFLYT